MTRLSLYIIFSTMFFVACRQTYEPPAISAPNRYLVVEGVINTTAGARTTIKLSRTRNLVDTFIADPERSASVQIESSTGTVYNLSEQSPGNYVSLPLNLNRNSTYRLKIKAKDGRDYASDFVVVKTTPPIDELTWRQDKDVTVYLDTHDPSNEARYYRWEFTETWQYRAEYEAVYSVNNGILFGLDTSNQLYDCWLDNQSSEIALGTSVKLSQDVINDAPVTIIRQNDPRIGVRYSILVRQYALTDDAYEYWEILQKNTESTGTLFDAQPGQLIGNIRNVADSDEPVLGYTSASSVQEARMFINHSELTDWIITLPSPDCRLVQTGYDPPSFPNYNYPDTSYAPYYFTAMGTIMVLTKKFCIDCTQRGGANKKPSFW